MVKKIQKIFIFITSGTTLSILAFMIYLFWKSSVAFNSMRQHSFSSPLMREPIRLDITKNGQTNPREITIDRDLFDYLSRHLRDTPYDGVGNYSRFMTAYLGLKELTDVEPLVAGMGPVINDVTSFRYSLNIAPCRKKIDNTNQRSLFVAVISAPNNFEKRATIRRTWLNHFKNQSNINKQLDVVGFGFFTGLTKNQTVQQKLTEESLIFNDILQVDKYDKYRNLSIKMAGLFNWINSHCSPVDFVLKVDDDVYVNVHNLATILHSFSPSEHNIYGHKVEGGHTSRTGKWPSSYENWPWIEIPSYLQRAGIVITGSAVRSLLGAMQTTPYYIWEDLYLIGLCAVKARLKILSSKRVFVDEPETYADPCFVRNTVMWTTSSEDHMNSSHLVSHNLYRNSNQGYCFLKIYAIGPNETLGALVSSKISEPAIASEFKFRSVHSKWIWD